MILVMRLKKWEDAFQLEPTSLLAAYARIQMNANSIGFLQIYDSIEQAKLDYPDGPFVEIRETL